MAPPTDEAPGTDAASGAAGPQGTDDVRDPAQVPPPGRRVQLVPAPAGLWQVLIGVGIAGLAPLFGFLVGTILSDGGGGLLGPVHLGLLVGIITGALGGLLAVGGAWRMYQARRREE